MDVVKIIFVYIFLSSIVSLRCKLYKRHPILPFALCVCVVESSSGRSTFCLDSAILFPATKCASRNAEMYGSLLGRDKCHVINLQLLGKQVVLESSR